MSPLKKIFATGLIFGLCAPMAGAAEWIEYPDGAARLPGTIRMENFNPALDSDDRVTVRPHLATLRDGTVVLNVYTEDTSTRLSSVNGFYTLLNTGTWQPFPADDMGLIYAEAGFNLRLSNGFLSDYDVWSLSPVDSTSSTTNEVLAAFPVLKPLGLFPEARAATFRPGSNWGPRGESLSDDGITGPSVFTTQVRDVAAALDPLGNPHVASIRGTETDTTMEVSRFRFNNWELLTGGIELPSSTSTTTLREISLGFSAVNPMIAYVSRRSVLDEIYVLEYDLDSSQWSFFDSDPNNPELFGQHPKILTFRDRESFWLAYEETASGSLKVLQRQNNELVDRGNPLQPWSLPKMAPFAGGSTSPAIANFDIALDRNGAPVVAFRAETSTGSGSFQIYVSYRNPTTGQWQAVGNPGEVDGASNIDYTLASPLPAKRGYGHYAPSIIFRSDNTPVLAWEFDDGSPSTPVIFSKVFDEALNPPPASSAAAIDRLIGRPNNTPNLDDNNDDIIDAADVERLVSRGL